MTNHKQELALGAALLPTDLAMTKWRELVSMSKIEEFEHSVTRTLPIVYLNCKEEISGNQLLKLKGSYRHSWARNTELFMQLKPVLKKLAEEGLDYRLLKGGAINMLIGPPGARIMGDIDLLIDKSDLHQLQDILMELGFRRMFSFHCKHQNKRTENLELNFIYNNSLEIDIHIVQERQSRRLFEKMMKNAPLIKEFSGIPVRIPSKELLIAHSLIHGSLNVQEEDESQMIMDVYTLLDSQNVENSLQIGDNLGIYSLFEKYFKTISRIGLANSFRETFKKQPILRFGNSIRKSIYSGINNVRNLGRAIWYRAPNFQNISKIFRAQKINRAVYVLWVYTGMLRPLELQIIKRLGGFTHENLQNVGMKTSVFNDASEWSGDWRFGFSGVSESSGLSLKIVSDGFINQSFLVFLNGKLIGVTESSSTGEITFELRELRSWNEISFRLPFSGCKTCSKSMKNCTIERLN